MHIDLNDDQLRAIVSGAILVAISPENRDEILRKATEELFKPSVPGLGGETVLEAAFRFAVRNITQEYLQAQFEEGGELRRQLESVINDAVRSTFEGDRRDKIVDKLADAIVNALARSRSWE